MNPYVITAEVRGDFSKVKKQMKEVSSTTKITVDSEGVTKATVETKKFADAQGNAVTQTIKLNKEGEVLNKTTTTQAKKLNTLSSSFKATIKSALLFTAAYGTLNLLMNNSIQTILDVDKALTELKKVSSLDNESLDEYTKKLGAMGQEVARTRYSVARVYSNIY